jgi:hypothetical protein
MVMVPLLAALSMTPVIEAVTGDVPPVMVITADILYPPEPSVVVAARATGSTTWLAPHPLTTAAAAATAHSNTTNLLLTAVMLPG